jgi:hypothetical protein
VAKLRAGDLKPLDRLLGEDLGQVDVVELRARYVETRARAAGRELTHETVVLGLGHQTAGNVLAQNVAPEVAREQLGRLLNFPLGQGQVMFRHTYVVLDQGRLKPRVECLVPTVQRFLPSRERT